MLFLFVPLSYAPCRHPVKGSFNIYMKRQLILLDYTFICLNKSIPAFLRKEKKSWIFVLRREADMSGMTFIARLVIFQTTRLLEH